MKISELKPGNFYKLQTYHVVVPSELSFQVYNNTAEYDLGNLETDEGFLLLNQPEIIRSYTREYLVLHILTKSLIGKIFARSTDEINEII